MSHFIEVKTAELFGAALDWAVAVADDEEHPQVYDGVVYVNGPKCNALAMKYCPSTDWAQGGPLVDRYCEDIRKVFGWWYATSTQNDAGRTVMQVGKTPLMDACRAIVAAELGDVVQVPAELAGEAK